MYGPWGSDVRVVACRAPSSAVTGQLVEGALPFGQHKRSLTDFLRLPDVLGSCCAPALSLCGRALPGGVLCPLGW